MRINHCSVEIGPGWAMRQPGLFSARCNLMKLGRKTLDYFIMME
jgi:hypothetical protein